MNNTLSMKDILTLGLMDVCSLASGQTNLVLCPGINDVTFISELSAQGQPHLNRSWGLVARHSDTS